MKKFFLFVLLCAATSLFAVDPRVETFDTKDGSVTTTYVSSVTTKECQQASWTVYAGGILKNLGNMGANNFASVTRAKKDADTEYPYMVSSTIEGGIDSLWFEWNSNGGESGNWNIEIYINDQLIDAITGTAGAMVDAGDPFNVYKKGNLDIEGDFTIKFVNKSIHSGAQNKNSKRFVIDNLSWMPKPIAGEKTTPSIAFAEEAVLKYIDADPFTNALTNGSDATPTFESSETAVATVDEAGKVTIVGIGETTITASVAETETYKASEASYTLRVVPMNFKMETFDGANNVDLSTNGTYLTTPTESFDASTATGLKWTTLLGSVRNNLGGGSIPANNLAAVIRAKKNTEDNYGYLLSSTISGGIDSLAFDWTCNGSEASRSKKWDIKIYINDKEVGAITDACTAIPAKPYRFSVGNIKIDGDFTIKIVNNNVPDDGTGNQYRWVVDNIEWYSYEAPHIYSVAGAEALLGSYWNEKEGNELELQDDGKYKLVLENVELAKGNYEYKVVIDHKWNNGEVQDNSVLSIDKSGIYDVTFTYDAAIPEVSAVADLKEEVVILPTVQLKGGFNGWDGEDLVPAEDKKSCSITRTIAQGDWSFKMYVNSQWLGEGQEITRENNTATATLDGADMTLKADKGGDYTFTWTYETNTLVVTFPAEDLPVEHIYSLAGSEGLFGLNWDPLGDFEMTKQDDGSYKYVMTDKELAKATYEFKVVIDHQWNNGEVADNSQLVIDKAGKYDITFTYVPDTKATAATAELKEELIIIPTVQLAGTFNSWSAEDLTAAEDKKTCSISKSIEAGEYTFKMIVAGSWLGGTQEFTRTNNTYVVDANGDNMKLVADRTGIYAFTWAYETNTLVIEFPVADGLDSTAAERAVLKQIVNGQLIITVDGINYDARGMKIR
ncbi:MAG: hypothetical protein J6P74_03030 [Paludibacteraceae bacterium]|nr:hypothetical protein [Paludibacteraceae bacterium]